MGTPRADVERLVVAAALALVACEPPDSTGLFGPARPAAIRTETPSIEAQALPSKDAGADAGVVGVPNDEGALPPGPLPVDPSSALEPAIDPPTPAPPRSDAGPPIEPPSSDAGSEPAAPPPVAEPACAGVLLDGICWYLGELDQTCDTVCAPHGGFDPAAVASLGTPAQGGSVESCAALLEALGAPSAGLLEGFRNDELGFGCHLFVEAGGATSAWWLTAPDFSPTVSNPSARLVCGCAG